MAGLKRVRVWRDAFLKDVAASTRSAALINWTPVALGAGIILYFGLRTEPQGWTAEYAFAACAILGALGLWLQRGQFPHWLWASPVAIAMALTALGFGLSMAQTRARAAPVITPVEKPIAFEGWVEREEAGPRLRRIVIRTSWVEGHSGRTRPLRVQIAAPRGEGVSPGRYVRCFGNLAPPPGPVTPGGYDFARAAWFQGIAATGSVLGKVEVREAGDGGGWLAQAQRRLSQHVRSRLDGSPGTIAAAFASGDYPVAAFLIGEALRLDPSMATADTDKRLYDKEICALFEPCPKGVAPGGAPGDGKAAVLRVTGDCPLDRSCPEPATVTPAPVQTPAAPAKKK